MIVPEHSAHYRSAPRSNSRAIQVPEKCDVFSRKKYFGYEIWYHNNICNIHQRLVQDLIAGKSLDREKILVILDEDLDVSGLYPLNEQKEARYSDSIRFDSIH
jgi:hypothetical protein